MAIKTNMGNMTPRRQAYRKEITLLSHGFSNPQAWPDGRLVVYPWDTLVDDFLVEQGRKANRTALVYGLLSKVCDLNGASVDDFVASEISSVLLIARAIAGGGAVRYLSQCPWCRNESEEKIQVPDELAKVGEKSASYPGYDEITLPDCKDILRIRPLLVKDERIITERTAIQRAETGDRVLHILMGLISVNGTTPESLREMITYFEALSPTDAKFLETQEDALTPHLETNIPHQCDACGKIFKHFLNFDQDFFR